MDKSYYFSEARKWDMSTTKRKLKLARQHRKQEKNFFVWTIGVLVVLIIILYLVFRTT